MIRVSGESKSRLVKAVGAESCGESRNQKLHAAVVTKTCFSISYVAKLHGTLAQSTFQVKMYKTRQVWTVF